jgi:hypothetical protein
VVSHIVLGSGDSDNTVGTVLCLLCISGKNKLFTNQGIILIAKQRNLINVFKPLGLLFPGQAKLRNKPLSVYASSLCINGYRLYIILCADIIGVLLATFC